MTNCELDIITIKGAPGTGKSQTSKCLAGFFPKGVRLEIDTLRSMVISVGWTDQEEHIRILSLSAELVHGFLRQGYRPIIVVDTFSGDKLNRYRNDLCNLHDGLAIRSFALVTDASELIERLERRPQDEFRDSVISLKLNSQVVKFLHSTEELVDTTHSSPMKTAEEIFWRLQESLPSQPDIK